MICTMFPHRIAKYYCQFLETGAFKGSKGSINTTAASTSRCQLRSFNSIKVRLIPIVFKT